MAERRAVLNPVDAEARRLAKGLVRTARHGALATLAPGSGDPQASRVAVATDTDGTPLILVSALSAHTPALRADPRASLLLGEPGRGDPLAHPRISLAVRAGELARGSEAATRARRRFLARHPKAALYADFADFAFFRLDPVGASLNGGFARAFALGPADLLAPHLPDLDALEAEASAHMTGDHADALALLARAAAADGGAWRVAGIDAEGMDLADGDRVARIWFDPPLTGADALRPRLVEMTRAARAAPAPPPG